MEMFLMVLCMSMLGLALTAIAFSSATRGLDDREPAPKQPIVELPAMPAAQFFTDRATLPMAARTHLPPVPVEALLLQLEQHIRLEHAAAEAFLEFPTAQSLHSRTTSPLVH